MNRLFSAHRRARERGRAFTLLELIVVIVLLGILALLAIPTFQHVITKSKKAVLTQNAEAVLRNAEADAALGIQAAGPVDQSLLPAAASSWEHTATPGSPTAFQPPSDGIAIWAQDGSAASPGTIEAYDAAWSMCVALQIPPTLQDGAAPPATSACDTSDPGSLSLMAVTTSPSATPLGVVAPFVPHATAWTFSGNGAVATERSPWRATPPGAAASTEVAVSRPTAAPVTLTSADTTTSGSASVSVSATSSAVKLSWSLNQATADGSFSIYRCVIAGCTPIASGSPLATVASTETSYTDSAVSSGATLSYQLAVQDSSGTELVSNIATVTLPEESMLSIFAGTGTAGAPTAGPATSSDLHGPDGVAVNPSTGNLFIADFYNDVVEKVTPSGTLSIVAGTGTAGAPTAGPATSSDLHGPDGVAVNPSTGNLFIADNGNKMVEQVSPSGTLSIVAGTGTYGSPAPGPATSSDLGNPYGVAVNPSTGNLYIADAYNNAIEQVTPSGTLSIVAGGVAWGAPATGPATSSYVATPYGVAVNPSTGDLYIAESGASTVAQVSPSGTLSIVAGTGTGGAPTPGPATSSDLGGPYGVAVNPSTGDVYIADTGSNVVETVTNP